MRLKECVNYDWDMCHIINLDTKRTLCGIKWSRKCHKRGYVWVPMIGIIIDRECKRCYKTWEILNGQ